MHLTHLCGYFWWFMRQWHSCFIAIEDWARALWQAIDLDDILHQIKVHVDDVGAAGSSSSVWQGICKSQCYLREHWICTTNRYSDHYFWVTSTHYLLNKCHDILARLRIATWGTANEEVNKTWLSFMPFVPTPYHWSYFTSTVSCRDSWHRMILSSQCTDTLPASTALSVFSTFPLL